VRRGSQHLIAIGRYFESGGKRERTLPTNAKEKDRKKSKDPILSCEKGGDRSRAATSIGKGTQQRKKGKESHVFIELRTERRQLSYQGGCPSIRSLTGGG